jgi:hypothetical protein
MSVVGDPLTAASAAERACGKTAPTLGRNSVVGSVPWRPPAFHRSGRLGRPSREERNRVPKYVPNAANVRSSGRTSCVEICLRKANITTSRDTRNEGVRGSSPRVGSGEMRILVRRDQRGGHRSRRVDRTHPGLPPGSAGPRLGSLTRPARRPARVQAPKRRNLSWLPSASYSRTRLILSASQASESAGSTRQASSAGVSRIALTKLAVPPTRVESKSISLATHQV